MKINPANGGVLVAMDSRGPNAPHAIGVVLNHGGGVPWLSTSDRVAFPMEDATEVWVDSEDYQHVEGLLHATPEPPLMLAYLLDQKVIIAKVA